MEKPGHCCRDYMWRPGPGPGSPSLSRTREKIESRSEETSHPYHLCVGGVGCERDIVDAMVIQAFCKEREEKEEERRESTTHGKPLGWTGISTTWNSRRLLFKHPEEKSPLFMPEFLCCQAWKITRIRVFTSCCRYLGPFTVVQSIGSMVSSKSRRN